MVGDDMFATEGDSVNVGRQGTAIRENGRAGGLAPVAADDVTVDVLRRLRDRVDRNVRLIDRMRADPLAPEPPGLSELIDTARRLRHDAETLLLLAGIEGDTRPGAPMRLSTLLDEAVDATEEPMRVDVRSGPNATVESAAAGELLHVVAEVVDHVTAIHPGGRIEVSSRTEAPGGIVVEVRTASTTRYDPSGRRGLAAAARIAQRSSSGLVLRTLPPGPAGSGAPIATIHCPGRVVNIQELDYTPPSIGDSRPGSLLDSPPDPWATSSRSGSSGAFEAIERRYGSSGGLSADTNGYARHEPETPVHGLPVDPQANRGPSSRTSMDSLFAELSAEVAAPTPADTDPFTSTYGDFGRSPLAPPDTDPFTSTNGRYGLSPLAPPDTDPFTSTSTNGKYGLAPQSAGPHVNGRSYPNRELVDELFGPMNLPAEPEGFPTETPIFAAVASAWFRDEAPQAQGRADAADWESPSDTEWRAAAERAAQPDTSTFTAEGLPRRRPGGRLVPPPIRDRGAGAHAQPAAPADRVPDRVRERLATYQRGLRQGRHRAEPADPGDPAAW
jgi:hypothetical protein